MVFDTANQTSTICDSHSVENKYIYPEFAGFQGERLLDETLGKIVSPALHRTWRIFVNHQAPGNECFLSISKW